MVRFFLWFLVLQAALFGLELTPWAQQWFVVPWTNTLAAISAGIVKLFDPQVLAHGKVLKSASNGFAVSIEAGRGPIPRRTRPTRRAAPRPSAARRRTAGGSERRRPRS